MVHQLMSWIDIDKKSLEYARKNVKLNGLEGRINVVSRNPTESLIPLDDLEIDSIGFCMTNPPFYESEEEMLRSANQKSRPPSTTCTGVKTEMVTEGGEVGFVERILEESLVLRKRVQWYTSMFGFSSSVTRLLEKLKDHRIDNYAVTEFVQGNKTRRWAVAWSFQSMRPTQSVARGTSSIQTKALLPLAAEVEVIVLPLLANISKFSGDFSGAIAGLDLMSWEWNGQRLEGIGRTVGNVWNRAWRRKKKREMNAQADGQKDQENWERPGFGFMVWVQVRKDAVSVGCRWLEGHDGTVFESFQGFLKSTARTLFPPGEGTSEK